MDKPPPPASPVQTGTPDPKPSASFGRFLSSVEGHLVSRYGSATNTQAPSLIGATREVKQLKPGPMGIERTEAKVVWDKERIVALTPTEARMFKREYDEAVKTGALKERTADDYDAYIAKQREASDAAKKKRDEERAEAEKKAKAEADKAEREAKTQAGQSGR